MVVSGHTGQTCHLNVLISYSWVFTYHAMHIMAIGNEQSQYCVCIYMITDVCYVMLLLNNSRGLIMLNVPAIISVWPGGTIWRHKPWSILVEVMACCLTAPNHYMKEC